MIYNSVVVVALFLVVGVIVTVVVVAVEVGGVECRGDFLAPLERKRDNICDIKVILHI